MGPGDLGICRAISNRLCPLINLKVELLEVCRCLFALACWSRVIINVEVLFEQVPAGVFVLC